MVVLANPERIGNGFPEVRLPGYSDETSIQRKNQSSSGFHFSDDLAAGKDRLTLTLGVGFGTSSMGCCSRYDRFVGDHLRFDSSSAGSITETQRTNSAVLDRTARKDERGSKLAEQIF